MNPRTSFATHHPQDSAYGPPHLVLEHLAAMANARRTGRYLRIPCPAHGGTNPNLALWVDGDSIGAKGHSAGCSYPDITAPIADRFGLSIARSQHERWPSRWSPASPPLSQLPHHLPASAPRPLDLTAVHPHPQIPRPSRAEVDGRTPSMATGALPLLCNPVGQSPASPQRLQGTRRHRRPNSFTSLTAQCLAEPPRTYTCPARLRHRRRQTGHGPRSHQENLRRHPGRGSGAGLPASGPSGRTG